MSSGDSITAPTPSVPSSPATLKQIAEAAGVSVSTVSHIMGTRGALYAPQTREKVMRLADELGYRPNAFARAVRSGRFGSVSLLLSNNPAHSSLIPSLMAGIHDALEQHELHMSLAMLSDHKLTDPEFVPRILRQWMADGLLIAYFHEIPEPFRDLLAGHRIPSVWINSNVETNGVDTDNFDGGKRATEHLLHLGHERIAFVDYTVPVAKGSLMHERYKGYAAAMRAAGLSVRRIGGKSSTPRGERLDKSREWLARDDRPTALVCFSESTALPVLQAALMQGLAVPSDLSLVTFGNEPLDSSGIHVTSMVVPFYDMGCRAVAMLTRKMAQPDDEQPREVLPFVLDSGDTCCPPSNQDSERMV